jgi:hypothetical protein
MGIDIFFSADTGSPFHQFIQSTAADETLELECVTLALGQPFIRVSQEDEYLAGRWYQVEVMLAGAFSGLQSRSSDSKFHDLRLWHLDNQNVTLTLPWSGGDSHSALRNIWAARLNILVEDELVNADSYLCTDSECGRSESGKGLETATALPRHMGSHDRGVAESEPLKKHTQTSCSDPRCGHITGAFFYAQHEEQHVDGRFACRACGLKYYHAATANEHALHECRVEDAVTIHIPPPMEVVCTEPICGHWRENTDLGHANMEKHFEVRHVKGKGSLPDLPHAVA